MRFRWDCSSFFQGDWRAERRMEGVFAEFRFETVALEVEPMSVRLCAWGFGSGGGFGCRRRAGGSGVGRLALSF